MYTIDELMPFPVTNSDSLFREKHPQILGEGWYQNDKQTQGHA